MLGWFFVSIAHALIGLVMLIGLFLGAVLVLARGIAKANEHDQSRCMCVMCQERRNTAHRKKFKDRDKPEPKPLNGLVSTEQLSVGMRVLSRNGTAFRVADIVVSDGYYFVTLKNMKTGLRLDPIGVSLFKAKTKMWQRNEGFQP